MDNKNLYDNNPLLNYEYKKHLNLNKKILLNEQENKIFSFIKNTLIKYNLFNKVICRIVGGWVRDKLLNIEKNDNNIINIDIDISITNMNSIEFAKILNKELNQKEEKLNIRLKDLSKGKEFDLVCIPIFGVKIDIVNIYINELKDAQRRDITINSIFYNLNEDKIEDLTEKGIKDLENGIINTPINVEESIEKNPIHILRIIRFAIKFNFKIEDEIINYIINQNNKIKDLINDKNYYDKIKVEFEKILELNNVHIAIYLLYKFNLLDLFLYISNFNYEKNINILKKEEINIVNLFIIANYLLNLENIKFDKNKLKFFNVKLYLSLLNYVYIKYLKKSNDCVLINLKFPINILKTKNLITKNINYCLEIINKNNYNRIDVGNLIRKIHYENIILLIYVLITIEYYDNYIKNNSNLNIINNFDLNLILNIHNKYLLFNDYIEKEKLNEIENIKPLLNINELIKEFNLNESNEISNNIRIDIINLQIDNPNISKENLYNQLKCKYLKNNK